MDRDRTTFYMRRAIDTANKLDIANKKIEDAKKAFDSIRHMGYVGDAHVDLAQKMFEELS